MRTLFIDLETFGNKPDEKKEYPTLILPTEADVAVGRAKDPSIRKSIIEEKLPRMIAEAEEKHKKDCEKVESEYESEWRGNALKSLKLTVICLCYAVDDGEVVKLKGTEEEIFTAFDKFLESEGHQSQSFILVGQNIKGFDIPIIWHRAIKYKLKHVWNTFRVHKYSDRVHDTQDMFAITDSRNHYSQDSISKFLGRSGKGDFCGKDVHDAYLRGEIDRIVVYCADDVIDCRENYYAITFKQ
jgi:predicted PolB exonuclease-like 3'-5' exonuclease